MPVFVSGRSFPTLCMHHIRFHRCSYPNPDYMASLSRHSIAYEFGSLHHQSSLSATRKWGWEREREINGLYYRCTNINTAGVFPLGWKEEPGYIFFFTWKQIDEGTIRFRAGHCLHRSTSRPTFYSTLTLDGPPTTEETFLGFLGRRRKRSRHPRPARPVWHSCLTPRAWRDALWNCSIQHGNLKSKKQSKHISLLE